MEKDEFGGAEYAALWLNVSSAWMRPWRKKVQETTNGMEENSCW